jgi:hypothetical protein
MKSSLNSMQAGIAGLHTKHYLKTRRPIVKEMNITEELPSSMNKLHLHFGFRAAQEIRLQVPCKGKITVFVQPAYRGGDFWKEYLQGLDGVTMMYVKECE